jgi:hypothetical protein
MYAQPNPFLLAVRAVELPLLHYRVPAADRNLAASNSRMSGWGLQEPNPLIRIGGPDACAKGLLIKDGDPPIRLCVLNPPALRNPSSAVTGRFEWKAL